MKSRKMKAVLEGIVEGMGMRPAVFRYSVKRGLSGCVANRAGRVEIIWQGTEKQIREAFDGLEDALPSACVLTSKKLYDCDDAGDSGSFSIIQDAETAYSVNLPAPPDRVPCEKCLKEISDPAGRRSGYAFNACAECGPRTTVMRALPYDRANTSWSDFPLCPECGKEYSDASDRRFHIEGISCPECGPVLRFVSGSESSTEDAIELAAETVNSGKILALKGVGGFQLICSPADEDAITRLRQAKARPHKPLALMAYSLETAEKYFEITDGQKKLLASAAGPAVILAWKKDEHKYLHCAIAPDGPREAAVMLPSSPLHKLLLAKIRGGLVTATSGNISGEPPALDNETALKTLGGIADAFLLHNRKIQWRNDDSIAAVNAGVPQVWRRARGYSSVLKHPFSRRVTAFGAGMKNTFAVTVSDRVFLSTHYGELENASVFRAWKNDILSAVRGFPEKPELAACDLHPDYPSSIFAKEFSEKYGIPLVKVQHHAAHALAAMLEAGTSDALVFSYDGTGLGADGTMWGAELFDISLSGGGRRIGTWKPARLPGGDAAVANPYRQLGARFYAAGLSLTDAEAKSPEHKDDIRTAYLLCEKDLNSPLSSAAGRLFDSAAALLGTATDTITYDGQPAVRLENAAMESPGRDGTVPDMTSFSVEDGIFYVSWDKLFSGDAQATPYGIHLAAADAIVRSAEYAISQRKKSGRGIPPVLLAGGVFQNRLLVSLVKKMFEERKIICSTPSEIPPGDGGIACGQAFWADLGFEMTGVNSFAKGKDV